MIAERRRPVPPPHVRPVYDHEASPLVAGIYSELKAVLQVPWVGMITRAYARYPAFFATLWGGMRELCRSAVYVQAARELGAKVDADVLALSPPALTDRLQRLGYLEEDFRNIRRVFEVFSHGNHLYQPLVMSALVLLEGNRLGSDRRVPIPSAGRHAPRVPRQFVLMEAHHVAGETRALYDDIKATLGLPYINSDYRALARWPSYLALAWSDLKPLVGTDCHRRIADAYHRRSVEAVLGFPNPGGLTPAAVRDAAARDASVDEVLSVVRLLLYNIPPLLVNMAYLRRQIVADGDARDPW